tara:strand:+ start:3770 stop:4999 length:1230 start_codon:yes stop_codon:yes gene_type:complete
MKIGLKHIKKYLILIPFFLITVSEIISFSNHFVGSILKLSAVVFMLAYVLGHGKFEIKLFLTFLIFIPILLYHIKISFNLNAAIEEGIRYCFPVVVLFYGYAIRKHYKFIIVFIIIFAVINNLYQFVNYFYWLIDVKEQWFYNKVLNKEIYYYNSSMGIIRGVGLIGFFAAYGFLNLIAFFLARQFYNGRYKNYLLAFLALGVIMSLSYKSLGVFLLLLFILSKHKLRIFIGATSLFLISLFLFPKKYAAFSEQISYRVETYITEGNSARAESYRVMFEEIRSFNVLGKGSGSFGGAASTKYDSPLYKEFNFNWHRTIYLATTDTYYPHLIVELGLIGSFFYFIILFSPIFKQHFKKNFLLIIIAIYFSLLFDSLFSFALNNLMFLMVSLLLIYPILEYEKNIITREYS